MILGNTMINSIEENKDRNIDGKLQVQIEHRYNQETLSIA